MTQSDDSPPGETGAKDRGSGRALRQFAYDRVEDLLNTGWLKPGQLVSQRELVELTGATLGSIREAIPKFEAEGLLVTVPKRGLMVPSLDVSFVREAYQVRRMIECAAVPHAIANLSDDAIDDFRRRFDGLAADLAAAGDEVPPDLLDRIQREDWNMHKAFVASVGNALLENIYRVTAIKIRLAVQARIRVTSENAQRVLKEHREIMAALATRDTAATENALAAHIDRSLALAFGQMV